MDYLARVLGIRVIIQDDMPISLPNYIHDRYGVQRATLDGEEVLLVRPREELGPIDAVKKHLKRIEQEGQAPAVLVLRALTYRQREYLLRDRIPFVVDGKQIYLPFMAVYLQERCNGERLEATSMLPSAQLLLLLFIYQGCEELLATDAAQQLGLTSTSISRASRQLEDMGLIQARQRGVRKVLVSDRSPKELFNDSRDSMNDPVKRRVYVSKDGVCQGLPLSGLSALSEYTMLNPSPMECFAAASIATMKDASSPRPHSSEEQCEVELWRYDPKKLAHGTCVDRLSLALSMRSERDERVEEAVEQLLHDVWKDIDDKRNR